MDFNRSCMSDSHVSDSLTCGEKTTSVSEFSDASRSDYMNYVVNALPCEHILRIRLNAEVPP